MADAIGAIGAAGAAKGPAEIDKADKADKINKKPKDAAKVEPPKPAIVTDSGDTTQYVIRDGKKEAK